MSNYNDVRDSTPIREVLCCSCNRFNNRVMCNRCTSDINCALLPIGLYLSAGYTYRVLGERGDW